MQDRYGLVGAVWGVGVSSAGHGHGEGNAGFTLVLWLHCTVWGYAAGTTPDGHNTEASSIPGHPVTLHTHPTEHSQDPAAPLTRPSSIPGHPSPLPALAPQPCPSRAVLGLSSGHCSSTMSYLSPSASSMHHTAPLAQLGPVPAPRARRRQSFPKQLKETASSSQSQAGVRQELSHPPQAGHKVLPWVIPVPPTDPREGLDLSCDSLLLNHEQPPNNTWTCG